MSQPTQQDIESWLWESANILRGPVDPANLRDFVFPLLFLKRLSDTWDEEQAKAIKKFGKDIDEDVAADFHTFQIPNGCHYADPDINVVREKVFDSIKFFLENDDIEFLERIISIEEIGLGKSK